MMNADTTLLSVIQQSPIGQEVEKWWKGRSPIGWDYKVIPPMSVDDLAHITVRFYKQDGSVRQLGIFGTLVWEIK